MTITGQALSPAMRRRSSASPAGTGLSVAILLLSGCLPAAPSAEKSEVRELSYPEVVRAYEKASGSKVWFSWDFDLGGVGLETLRLRGEDHAPEFLWRRVRFGELGVVRVDGSDDVILAQDVRMASGEMVEEGGRRTPRSWVYVYVHLPLIGLDELEGLQRMKLKTVGRKVEFCIETMQGERDARCSRRELDEMLSADTACAEIDGKWGHMDRTGKVIVEPRFDGARPFSEDLAGVKVGGRWGYIDRTGRMAIEARYDVAGRFVQGVARVWADGKWLDVDKSGNCVRRQEE